MATYRRKLTGQSDQNIVGNLVKSEPGIFELFRGGNYPFVIEVIEGTGVHDTFWFVLFQSVSWNQIQHAESLDDLKTLLSTGTVDVGGSTVDWHPWEYFESSIEVAKIAYDKALQVIFSSIAAETYDVS